MPQVAIHKIVFYDGAMGEFGEVTAPNDIKQVMNALRKLEIYNEKAEPNPTTVNLSHGCLYWLDFFETVEDEHPAFSIGLDSFFIDVGREKTGPYRTENEGTVITEILGFF